VRRFKCLACERTFSTQTYSIDFYTKKKVDYSQLLIRHSSSESCRSLSRGFGVSCGTIANRIERMSRQAAALHARLRPLASLPENVCVDGFVSFDRSQFFPNEITFSITSGSRLVLDLTHATHRRSGSMREAQKERSRELYEGLSFERDSTARSFREILDSLRSERPPSPEAPLVIVTDEKREYARALHAHPLFSGQDELHRVAQLTVNSHLPRTFANPLFASNYLDREIRKDQANHHRESTCFSRNVSNAMARLICYVVQHNYRKKYLIKSSVRDTRVHGEVAGIEPDLIRSGVEAMFVERSFLSRIRLPPTLLRIWMKSFITPGKSRPEYLPQFALA